jgi:hypothetical protein
MERNEIDLEKYFLFISPHCHCQGQEKYVPDGDTFES